VSQNVWSTTRPLPSANAGGLAASFHVRPPERREIVRGLDRPSQVDDAVRAAEERHEVVVLDVRRPPLGLVEVP